MTPPPETLADPGIKSDLFPKESPTTSPSENSWLFKVMAGIAVGFAAYMYFKATPTTTTSNTNLSTPAANSKTFRTPTRYTEIPRQMADFLKNVTIEEIEEMVKVTANGAMSKLATHFRDITLLINAYLQEEMLQLHFSDKKEQATCYRDLIQSCGIPQDEIRKMSVYMITIGENTLVPLSGYTHKFLVINGEKYRIIAKQYIKGPTGILAVYLKGADGELKKLIPENEKDYGSEDYVKHTAPSAKTRIDHLFFPQQTKNNAPLPPTATPGKGLKPLAATQQ